MVERIIVTPDNLINEHRSVNNKFVNRLLKAGESCLVFNCAAFIVFQNEIVGIKGFNFDQYSKNLYEKIRGMDEICKRLILEEMGLNSKRLRIVSIAEIINKTEWELTCELLTSILPKELIQIQYGSIAVGKSCLIDLSLTAKASVEDLENNHIFEFAKLITLLNIIAVKCMQKLREEQAAKCAEMQVIQNSQYSQNHCIQQYCDRYRINCIYYEQYPYARDEISIFRSKQEDMMMRRILMAVDLNHDKQINYWNNAMKYLIDRMSMKRKLIGQSYSSDPVLQLRKTPYEEYLIGKGVEINSYFTSSPDEDRATECWYSKADNYGVENVKLFRDEEDFLVNLCDIFRNNKRKHLFVRVHPRLARDMRGLPESPQKASYLKRLRQIFKGIDNVTVIEPEAQISSYWLACWSTKVFAWRGTLPIELGLLGIRPIQCLTESTIHNTGINSYSLESRRSLEQWKEVAYGTSVDIGINYDLGAYVREFYYFMKLGRISISEDTSDQTSTNEFMRAMQTGSSINILNNYVPNIEEDKGIQELYLQWLLRFVMKNIVANTKAPAYERILRIIKTLDS